MIRGHAAHAGHHTPEGDPSARYWEFDRAGGPEVLRLAQGPRQEPGHGEVRLNVEALSFNRSDLMFLADGYAEKPILPSRFGSEVSAALPPPGPLYGCS